MSDRRLASIEHILDVRPIDGAFMIEQVTVRGWNVVVSRGEFKTGDQCVYFEIDSALPLTDKRFAFLAGRGTKRTVTGLEVHVLKTARLRGVYSQGLALNLGAFAELAECVPDDVAGRLGIEKWEPPMVASTVGGDLLGPFPSSLARKTDAERIQNLSACYDQLRADHTWWATEKVDGTSATFIQTDDGLRVCGRNWELQEGSGHHLIADAYSLSRLEPGLVVQGEIYGEGIQRNPLQVSGRRLTVFGVCNGRDRLPRTEWPSWLMSSAAPIYEDLQLPATIAEAVAQVDGIKSLIAPERLAEGVAWNTSSDLAELDYRPLFKIVSNRYLLKNGG